MTVADQSMSSMMRMPYHKKNALYFVKRSAPKIRASCGFFGRNKNAECRSALTDPLSIRKCRYWISSGMASAKVDGFQELTSLLKPNLSEYWRGWKNGTEAEDHGCFFKIDYAKWEVDCASL